MDLLGRGAGRHLHALANIRDPRRVERGRRRRSIGAQHALGRRSRSPEAVDAALVALVDRVTGRLRKARPRVPDGGAAAALRRLQARHALAHAGRADRPHATRCSPPRGPCSPRRPAHRASRDHARGRGAHEPRGLRRRRSSPSTTAPRCSIRRSIELRERFGNDAITQRRPARPRREPPAPPAPRLTMCGPRTTPSARRPSPTRPCGRRSRRRPGCGARRGGGPAARARRRAARRTGRRCSTESAMPRGSSISPGSQCGALDLPREHVLEPAEGRPARARHLLRAPAVLALDRVAAPGAALCRLRRHGGAAPDYRPRGRRDRSGAARAGAARARPRRDEGAAWSSSTTTSRSRTAAGPTTRS